MRHRRVQLGWQNLEILVDLREMWSLQFQLSSILCASHSFVHRSLHLFLLFVVPFVQSSMHKSLFPNHSVCLSTIYHHFCVSPALTSPLQVLPHRPASQLSLITHQIQDSTYPLRPSCICGEISFSNDPCSRIRQPSNLVRR